MQAGYTTDVPFPATFAPQQAPIHVAAIAALSGVDGAFDDSFAYCDFGCGEGLTVALLAACYPQARFYGVDVNPAHIEAARAFAKGCAIDNVDFIEADFLAFESGALPPLDYAAISGVYSWLPAEKRRGLASIVSSGLKAGGACAVQYRCMPGVAPRIATDGLATFLAAQSSGASSARIVTALGAISNLLGAPDLPFNRVNPTARDYLKEQLAADPNYLAHDVLNADHAGVWFHQVAADFRASGLDFVAQLRPQMNACPDLFEPQLAQRFSLAAGGYDDPIAGQELINIAVNAGSRWDLFVKPRSGSTEARRTPPLRRLFVRGLAGVDHRAPRQALSGRVTVDLFAPVYDAALDMLASEDVAGETLMEKLAAQASETTARRALMNLLAIGLIGFSAAPSIETAAIAAPAFSATERRLLFETLRYEKPQPFPSRRLGNCVPLPLRDRAILASMAVDSVEAAWALIEEKGASVRTAGGREIMSLERFKAFLSEEEADFRAQRLPALLRLGLFQ